MINQIIDCALVLIIVIGAIIGAKRGFIKSVLKTGAGIISLLLAYSFTKPFASFLSEKYIFSPVKEKIGLALEGYIESDFGGLNAETLLSSVPDSLKNVLSLVGYDIEKIATEAVQSGNQAIESFIEKSSALIANALSTIIAFAVLFLGSFILLRILAFVLNAIVSKIPGIAQMNSALGLLFGLICTVINIWIFSGIAVTLIEAIRTSSPDFLSAFAREDTVILKLFTSFNPISLFFSNK